MFGATRELLHGSSSPLMNGTSAVGRCSPNTPKHTVSWGWRGVKRDMRLGMGAQHGTTELKVHQVTLHCPIIWSAKG